MARQGSAAAHVAAGALTGLAVTDVGAGAGYTVGARTGALRVLGCGHRLTISAHANGALPAIGAIHGRTALSGDDIAAVADTGTRTVATNIVDTEPGAAFGAAAAELAFGLDTGGALTN